MQRKFFSNLFFLVLLNIIVKPFWIFGIDRMVQMTVGTEQYGFYYSLLNLSFLLSIFTDFGLTNFNNKSISEDPSRIKDYFSPIISLKLILCAVYLVASLLIGAILGLDSAQFGILLVLCLNQVLSSFILYVRSNISALHFFVLDSILSVTDKFLMIVFCGAFLYTHIFHSLITIEIFVFAQTFAYAITLVISIIALFILTKRLPLNFHFGKIKKVIRQSFPYALLILMMTAYTKVDAVMLERMLGVQGDFQAGVYASAYRLLDVLNQFGYLVAALLLPIFSRMLSKKDPTKELSLNVFTLVLAIALPVCLFTGFYAKEIMLLLNHHANDAGSAALTFLIYCFIGTCTGYVFGTLLTAAGKLMLLVKIAFCAFLINVGLNAILIPVYGSSGAAVAALFTQTFMALATLLAAFRYFKFSFPASLFFRILIYTIVLVLFVYLSVNLEMNWKMKGIIVLLLSPMIALMLRLVQLRKVFQLLSSPRF